MPRKAIEKPDFSLIYPGIYKTTGLVRKSLLTKLNSGVKKIKPSVSVIESPDEITIQLLAPGFLRENFVVMIKNCRLSIYALHQKLFSENAGGNLPREFDYYFSRRMQLPQNVDPDFVSAEYKDGILCMRFLKSYQACVSKRHQIAVY